jgi:hypothetical protein
MDDSCICQTLGVPRQSRGITHVFNFDFLTFLGLSGIWVAWRHQFSAGGIALAVLAFFGGMVFLAPYLLYASVQAGGEAKVLLLGKGRSSC